MGAERYLCCERADGLDLGSVGQRDSDRGRLLRKHGNWLRRHCEYHELGCRREPACQFGPRQWDGNISAHSEYCRRTDHYGDRHVRLRDHGNVGDCHGCRRVGCSIFRKRAGLRDGGLGDQRERHGPGSRGQHGDVLFRDCPGDQQRPRRGPPW